MGVLLILFLVYPIWGFPGLIIFNYFLTKKLCKTHSGISAGVMAFFISAILFMPLAIPAQSFFSEIYVPWYLSLLMTPPSPEFSLLGFGVTALLSLVTSTLFTLNFKSQNFKFPE